MTKEVFIQNMGRIERTLSDYILRGNTALCTLVIKSTSYYCQIPEASQFAFLFPQICPSALKGFEEAACPKVSFGP